MNDANRPHRIVSIRVTPGDSAAARTEKNPAALALRSSHWADTERAFRTGAGRASRLIVVAFHSTLSAAGIA